MNKILNQAMTNDAPELSLEASVAADAIIAANEVDVNDLQVLGASMESLDLQMGELESAEDFLTKMTATMESALADGGEGLSREAAGVVSLSMESIFGTELGSQMLSLESFGGTTSRIEATELSLESVGGMLKKIWESIKRNIANAMNAVADFVAKLFGSTDKLKARAEAIIKTLEEQKKSGAAVKGDGKFEIPGASRLYMGGKIDEKVLDAGMKVTGGEIVGSYGEVAKTAIDYYDDLAKVYTKKDEIESDLTDLHTKGQERVVKSVKKIVGVELPGGKAFIHTTSESDDDAKAMIAVPKLGDYSKKVKFNGKSEISVPSIDWAIAAAKDLIKMVDHIAGAKKNVEALAKSRKDAVAKAESFVKDSDAGKLGKAITNEQVRWAMSSANRDFNKSVSTANGFLFNYVRNMLTVVEGVSKQYKEKKAG